MKKLLFLASLAVIVLWVLFLASCNKDKEFSDKNTFNLDTLFVNPATGISNEFQVLWGVTTEGFPQFLIDIYLSDDKELDATDLKIAETADTDTGTDPGKSYVNGVNFRMSEVSGGSGTLFEFSYDLTNWEGDGIAGDDLTGASKYIIGRFYHTPGLQIEVMRTRMAVPVTFQ